MRYVCHLLAFCLLVVPALAQDDLGSSELERALSPQQLQQLVESRDRAQQELRRAETDVVSPEIFRAFRDPHISIAIVTMTDVITPRGGYYSLKLKVEKILRGSFPENIAVQCYWQKGPWLLRPPRGAQRIQPVNGRRILAGVDDPGDKGQDRLAFFQGVLNLDDSAETALLPYALAAAEMDTSGARSKLSGYEKGLSNENSAVRDLAVNRLLQAKECRADPQCEESILNETRLLLGGRNPNQRMEAVEWLGKLGDAVGDCWMRACATPQFQQAPVRELLQMAMADQNVAVGDLAFQFLATLDFHQKENAGYCEEIVPAMRTVKRYPAGEKHTIGGSLSGASICLGAQER